MEMQHVRYFVALAGTLNFTRAAEQCNVSQPALTRAIQQLEHELGGPLFHRERGNTHLSELGRMMLPYLQTVEESCRAARDHVIFGMDFEPQARRRRGEGLSVMLGFEADTGGGNHGQRPVIATSEPLPLGVLMLAQVPLATYFQALPA